jgi:16S rRNA (uracil1498-N3)-methyltransferase
LHSFYEKDLHQEIISLSQEESMHCARVLRLRAGDEIMVTDGQGSLCRCRLLEVNTRACGAVVTERKVSPPRAFRLHMAVAPTKNMDRFEWFLEKATECGIEEITPLICEHSERTILKTERLQKILLAAMKQSQRVYLPKLNQAISTKEFFHRGFENTPAFIAWCGETEKQALQQAYTPGQHALVMIGPEGDFSLHEVELAAGKGARIISLGSNRLRTETAALLACMGINFINGEYQ